MKYYYFIEFAPDNGDRIKYYKIKAPIPYRQGISLNGFRNLQHKILNQRWFYFKFQDDFNRDMEQYKQTAFLALRELYNKYLNLPMVECEDLYDFYIKIGWDRKKKIFV